MAGAITRDRIMFALGAAGFLHELILGSAERPFLLALSGALMGLPFVLAADRAMRVDLREEEDDEKWSHLP